MQRRLCSALLALGLLAVLGAPPAQAATQSGTVVLGWDYTGETDGGITLNGFLAACEAGQIPGYLASPLNGVDGMAFDLKSEKMGAFSVKGPGASPVGPGIPVLDWQLTSYDLDLYFFTESCDNANNTATDANKCYSRRPSPDEKTPCIIGYKSGGKVRGARYVIVALALNLSGGPVDFVLTTP